MDDPAQMDARALRLEEEADDPELAGRNAAAQGRLQQAKSLRDQATLQRQRQGCIHAPLLIQLLKYWPASSSVRDTLASSPCHWGIMLIIMLMIMS